MEALVRHIFINKKAFRSGNAAPQKLYKIFVMNATDQIDLIEEMICPLCCNKAKPFDGHGISIWKNSLYYKNNIVKQSVSYNLVAR